MHHARPKKHSKGGEFYQHCVLCCACMQARATRYAVSFTSQRRRVAGAAPSATPPCVAAAGKLETTEVTGRLPGPCPSDRSTDPDHLSRCDVKHQHGFPRRTRCKYSIGSGAGFATRSTYRVRSIEQSKLSRQPALAVVSSSRRVIVVSCLSRSFTRPYMR